VHAQGSDLVRTSSAALQQPPSPAAGRVAASSTAAASQTEAADAGMPTAPLCLLCSMHLRLPVCFARGILVLGQIYIRRFNIRKSRR
jgi:hypothetical protein